MSHDADVPGKNVRKGNASASRALPLSLFPFGARQTYACRFQPRVPRMPRDTRRRTEKRALSSFELLSLSFFFLFRFCVSHLLARYIYSRVRAPYIAENISVYYFRSCEKASDSSWELRIKESASRERFVFENSEWNYRSYGWMLNVECARNASLRPKIYSPHVRSWRSFLFTNFRCYIRFLQFSNLRCILQALRLIERRRQAGKRDREGLRWP